MPHIPFSAEALIFLILILWGVVWTWKACALRAEFDQMDEARAYRRLERMQIHYRIQEKERNAVKPEEKQEKKLTGKSSNPGAA